MVVFVIEVLLIAVSLALDAFAVAVSSGISVKGFGWRHAVKMGIYFGFFQMAMPLIGWLLGSGLSGYIVAIDHWVAFALLGLIGGRMVWEAAHKDCSVPDSGPSELSARRLVVLAVATSIDALAVGVSMAFMDVNILLSAAVIGVVALVLSMVGGLLGKRLGCIFQKRAEIVGGLVLIAIGGKILFEHLTAGG